MVQIRLEVQAGLANRIRAMVSGICLAEELGAPLVVYWDSRNSACACRLEAIFNPESLPSFVYWSASTLPFSQECLSVEDCNRIVQGWNKKDHLCIRSYGRFYGGTPEKDERWLTHLRALRPTPQIQLEVSRRLAKIPIDQALGVHIRVGDNIKAREASPFWAFLRVLNTDTSPFFVVATDDTLLRDRMAQHFMDRCIFPSQFSSRTTEVGMIEAAIDFFSLARCKRILGSVHSSFSHIAALYGGAELILAKKDEGS